MALPFSKNALMRDFKRLVRKQPIAMSLTMAGAAGAIALIAIPFSQQPNGTDESRQADENTPTDLLNSEIFTEDTVLSDDDIRIGADIDNLDVLLNELELSDDAADTENPQGQDPSLRQSNRASPLLELSDMANPEPTDATSNVNNNERSPSIYDDLFSPITVPDNTDLAVPIRSLLSGGMQPNSNTPSSNTTNGNQMGRESFGNSQITNTVSNEVLRYPATASNNLISSEAATQNQSNPVVPNRLNPGSLNQAANQTSSGSLQLSTDAIQLQTSPLPGTTGYRIPQAFQSPINPYTQQVNPQFNPSSLGQFATPTLPSALTVPQPLSSPGFPTTNIGPSSGFNNSTWIAPGIPTTQPFTPNPQPSFAIPTTQTPQSTRYNGGGRGGEINTFSNP